MNKKIGIEPREVDLEITPSAPLTEQEAQEIAQFVAASKRKRRGGAGVAAKSQHPAPATGK